MKYRCPLCSQTLQIEAKSWRCSANHVFDCAKEGYVNLLPVQKKNSKDPGDNKLMILARREFLTRGYYQRLSDRVNQLANEFAVNATSGLDVGCGEGYYSHRLFESMRALAPKDISFSLQGLDISKSALKFASKRYPSIDFCVASAFEMPFYDSSFDFMLRIYAPSLDEELWRVMKKEGILVTVSAGPKHHFALKKLIYDEPELHTEESSDIQGFELLHNERLEWILEMDNSLDINHFLNMTPYAWKLTDSQKQVLSDTGLTCELDFKIEVFKAI
ncbi:23S rRNA (guanine(745)-N(1))-methyltransferase [Shewanella surugensis]|uniref:23S rRNA (Guanine(745)-N(1))-methyltransferase n=1 Tax=Shewanella surugensis TaxID=212020 RepID=A0ABT0L889_9GAMM|nr:23S rRNA (guanine(745)-N(1))-methyltransferase [Shewanella surugensis]MCL1123610.1 23S rRNA (guanine(745)-N(1))-methyltransferase [Shewanella surugensis]